MVLVARAGKVLHLKAYGMAGIRRQMPLTTTSVFDLGSIGKPITALAIMLLAEDGKLNYDKYLCRFFPEFSTYAPTVTLRHFLQHTAGFPDYEELFERTGQLGDNQYPRSASKPRNNYEPTASDALRLLSKQHLRFPPGTKYEYSNSGYVLLGQVVAKVSGQRYATFVRKRILQPLRMTRSVVYDESRPAIPGRAVSYKRSRDTYEDIDYSPLSLVYGDGGINSSVPDLFKLDAVLTGGSFLRRETLLEAFRSGILPDGTATGYGFGWFVRPALGMTRISHGGTWLGLRSILVRYPQQQFTVIVLGNFLDIEREKLAYQVARIYLSDIMLTPQPVRLPDSSLDLLTGVYDGCKWLKVGTKDCEGEVEPDERYQVGRDGMDLSLQYPDGTRVTLLPLSAVEFFISGREDTRVVFHYTQQHSVTGMSITNFVQQTAQKSR